MLTLVNVGVDQARFPNRGFKGGVISEGVFNLVQSPKNDPNHRLSAFLPKVKSLGTVIWVHFLSIGPNLKNLLRLPNL